MRISHINFSGEKVPFTILNIIVGPNGAGKTTLLKDLHSELTGFRSGGTHKWTNLLDEDSFTASLQDWKSWRDSLEVVTGESHGNGGKYYVDPKSMGRQNKPKKIMDTTLGEINQAIASSEDSQPQFSTAGYSIDVDRDIVMPFRDQRSVFMTVDDRFYLSNNNAGQHNVDTNNSIQPAPFLADNDDILKSINSKLIRIFGKKLFSESRTTSNFSLYVGSSETTQPKRYTNLPKNYKKIADTFDAWSGENGIIELQNEGHGVRAAVQVLYELENNSNQIIFLDEPEMHLYPSAKYLLGKFIGEYARRGKKQIIITTHDSDMLRGLIDASSVATVIRIDQNRSVKFAKDTDISKTIPSTVLQSAFLDAVIITEGIGDQYVYEGAMQHSKLLPKRSYQVISMNGKETVSHCFYFFKLLGIKYAAIYDFDVLWHVNRGQSTLKACLNEKGVEDDAKNALLLEAQEIDRFMKGKNDKKRGINCPSLSTVERQKLQQCLSNLANEGIFISPVGELEDWVGVDKSDGKKVASPEQILKKYKARSKSKYINLTNFIKGVADYLEGQFS